MQHRILIWEIPRIRPLIRLVPHTSECALGTTLSGTMASSSSFHASVISNAIAIEAGGAAVSANCTLVTTWIYNRPGASPRSLEVYAT
jgi:hypothetical protein